MKGMNLAEQLLEKTDSIIELLDDAVDDRFFIVTDLAYQLKDELESLRDEE
jgi:hypothetical protein